MKVFNLLRNTRPHFTHCISEFLYLGIFSPRNISSVIFHRTSTEKSIIFHRTESYNVFVLSSSSIFLSKNEVFMELKLVYIRRAKYLLLCVPRIFNGIQTARVHSDIHFSLRFSFPRKKKMLQKKKIGLIIVSTLNEASR